eukprot:39156-Chlamydomonas_euryale.AAC.1
MVACVAAPRSPQPSILLPPPSHSLSLCSQPSPTSWMVARVAASRSRQRRMTSTACGLLHCPKEIMCAGLQIAFICGVGGEE